MAYLLGIDIGTSGTKTVLLTTRGYYSQCIRRVPSLSAPNWVGRTGS